MADMSKCSLAAQLRNSEEALATQSEPETSSSPILRLLPRLQYHGDWAHEDQESRAGFFTAKMRALLVTGTGTVSQIHTVPPKEPGEGLSFPS